MGKGCFLAIVCMLFALTAKAQSPCDITASINKGCIPLPVSFSFTTTNKSPIVSYSWDFGDGGTSAQAKPTNFYFTTGSYRVKVRVKFKDSTTCSDTLKSPVIVYSNPVVDFDVNSNKPVILCTRGQTVCFKDKSGPGKDKAPIVSRLWSFGDGSLSTKQNPCYAYADSGVYKVTLEVVDSNGCKQHIQKNITIRFTSDIGINVLPKFKIYLSYDCKKNIENVLFTNTTDTAYEYLTKFAWDYGDGARDSCDVRILGCKAKWTGFSHAYTKTGSYRPSLYVENKYGCSNKIFIDTPIVIAPFKLDVQVFDNPDCYISDSIVSFLAPFNTYARYYSWDFGDPLSRSTGVLAATGHTYKEPGIFTVHLKVMIGNCPYDTTLCKRIKLLGPIARIMPFKGYSEAWDKVPPNGSYAIPVLGRSSYFDTSCAAPSFITYYTYTPTNITNGEPVYDPCRADTVKILNPDSLYACNGKRIADYIISYKQHIKSYKDTIEQIATAHTWAKPSPVPVGNIYSKPPFINKPLFMDDSSLFSVRCKAPQKISFTNFSVKYRGYDALDNFPPGYADICKNPAYPYASDSMQYLWDFREGNAGTSTKANPDIKARHSTEKLPTHLFQKDGCYWVVLTTSDSITNCSDQDSLPVVLQTPDAGWAPQYSNIKNMTRLIQDSLPAKGPRRGARVFGIPCLEDTQRINLSETLPSCYKPDFSLILDSAKQVFTCNKTTKHLWMSKDSIAKHFSYHFLYGDTGWKTIGVVMRNNSNCSDTVWYHQYNYIHGTYPAINVSAKHICAGDTLKMSPIMPKQLGIKSFVYYYAEEKDRGDTNARFKPDTVRHRIIKHLNRPADTITSTVHNKDWGIDDGPLNFNYLTDTMKKVVPSPGHFTIITVIRSRFGCIDTGRTQVTVGHYTDFSAMNNTLCVNDTARFYGLAQYFVPFTKLNDGYDQRLFWKNPDSVRKGRKTKIPEQMQWDLDGDGIIDYTGVSPSFTYKKAGSYTVTMFTRDSSGCIQKLERKDYIKVIGAQASFAVDSPGDTRYCTGLHFFQFRDSSYVVKPFKDSLNRYKIYSWIWDFGDSTPVNKITDPARKNASHVYAAPGEYTVTLTVSTAPGGGAGLQGCTNTTKKVIHIIGPTAHFTVIGPDKGCVPFTLKVRDESRKAQKREWILGDGTTVNDSVGDSIVYLTYKTPGIFCPQFYVIDNLIDLQGKPLHCADTFPAKKCDIKVEVYKLNVQTLSVSDTLVCLHRDTLAFRSLPETGYKKWTIRYGNGDSASNTLPRFTYSYDKTGRYQATISGTGAHCPEVSSVKVHVIDIKADFAVDTAKKDTPVFNFINHSAGGIRFVWDFGDGSTKVYTKSADPVSHEFIRAGKSTICLVAYNEKSCRDSICKDIVIDTFVTIPNVFTPNGDAFNNHYVITIYGNKLYDLDIYNRWGENVFHSNDKNDTWDGTDRRTGRPCAEGAYYGIFKYRFIGGRNQFARTSVTLLRK